MQKYWTILKLLCLGVGLVVLVLAQRGPAYVSLWLIAGDDGSLVAVEIDGDRIGLDSPQSHLVGQRFQSALASRGNVGNPWIQIQIDDEIPWKEAQGALALAFDLELEPTISIVKEFSETPRPGEQIVLHQPGLSTAEFNVNISIRNELPGPAGFYLNDTRISPQATSSADQLNQSIRKLIGEPESEKAQRMRADITIEETVRFRSVREALEAVSGGRTVITDEWMPYIRLFRINGMQWSDPEDPFQRHGGVI
jgi:hypothetical protein